MIVHRLSARARPERYYDLLELLKTIRAGLDDPGVMRILADNIGPAWTIVYELTFENLAALEQAWDEWRSNPENAELMEKWLQVVDGSGSSEVWTVVE
jgi:hypothetical protein